MALKIIIKIILIFLLQPRARSAILGVEISLEIQVLRYLLPVRNSHLLYKKGKCTFHTWVQGMLTRAYRTKKIKKLSIPPLRLKDRRWTESDKEWP